MQAPQKRAFGCFAALKCLILNKQCTFMEGFKTMLCKLQLLASHKLHVTLASVISLKYLVD
jgi:hypothetical protein